MNPIVTLNHRYDQPPVARSLWRKVMSGGVKAKTIYPAKPKDWPEGEPWPTDKIFGMVQAGLLNAKSIGWLPVETHLATPFEQKEKGYTQDTLIIDRWILIEYAIGTIPVNPQTVAEVVAKTMKGEAEVIPFTTAAVFIAAIERRLDGLNVERFAREAIERRLGKV